MSIEFPDTLNGIWLVCILMLAMACLFCAIGLAFTTLPLRVIAPRVKPVPTAFDLEKPHPQGKFIAIILYIFAGWCLVIPLVLLIQQANRYNRLEVSNDGQSLTVQYLFSQAPKRITFSELQVLHVDQWWVPRGSTHQYYWFVIPEIKGGQRFEPSSEIRLVAGEKSSNEFRKLEAFIGKAKQLRLPLKFTFRDPERFVHVTNSLTERPNDREQIPGQDARLFP